jgi:subtilase family serine protease
MANRSDVDQIASLESQAQQIEQAISYLDAGSPVSSVLIGPPPAPPDTVSPIQLAVTIAGPMTDPNILSTLRAQLVVSHDQIIQQLADLGVT